MNAVIIIPILLPSPSLIAILERTESVPRRTFITTAATFENCVAPPTLISSQHSPMQPPMKTAAPMPGAGGVYAHGPTGGAAPMYAPAQQQFGQFPIQPALQMPTAPSPGGGPAPPTPGDAPPAYQVRVQV